jgi:hypothetical protein
MSHLKWLNNVYSHNKASLFITLMSRCVCLPLQAISQITGAVDESMAKTLAESAQAAQQVEATADSELRSKVVAAVHQLQTGLLERETEVSHSCCCHCRCHRCYLLA